MKTLLSRILKNSRPFRSLKFRIFILMMLIGVIPSVVTCACILLNYENQTIFEKTVDATNQGRALSNHLTEIAFLNNVGEEALSELSALSDYLSGRIMVIDSDLRVLSDTYSLSLGKTVISREVVDCFLTGQSNSSHNKKEGYIELTIPITGIDSSEAEGVMLISISTEPIRDSVETLRRKSWIFVVTVSIFVFVISLTLSQLLLRPFVRMTKAISSIREGFDNEAITIPDYTETEALTDAFNDLMSRMKKLDDSREEFVSNVSHELKTPLASMKVLSDSLREGGDIPVEVYREFMDDIAEEVDRENQIITDLLSLVKMDRTSENALNIDMYDINEIIERILKTLRPIAEKENVELIFESMRSVSAEVDETKFSLAIMNFVENAIKYNKSGGYVRVSLDADHQFFAVTVEDSGIGIPEEAQQHIFERFYRVDKSHSREIGGTGLGLSIARSAVLMHRGAVKVTSVEGEGTTFTIRIPLKYLTQAPKA
ncbi:MAG: HAMP domain-containing histidine kinase [Lachnospiraceae bacterium]|nr:HAMP domain-containing histidine kinase [Lachnospiraceae bacterium]